MDFGKFPEVITLKSIKINQLKGLKGEFFLFLRQMTPAPPMGVGLPASLRQRNMQGAFELRVFYTASPRPRKKFVAWY